MGIREQIEKVIRDESGSYQLMAGKMRAIDLDRCEVAFIDKLLSLVSEAKWSEWVDTKDRYPDVNTKDKWDKFLGAFPVASLDKPVVRVVMCEVMPDGSKRFSPENVTHWMPLPQPPKSEEENV